MKEDNFFKLKYNKVPPAKGLVLVSEPYSSDNFFRRSVVLLVEHNESGSLGFILNKDLGKPLNEMTEHFGRYDGNLSIGGPVGNGNLYFIHTFGKKIRGSIPVKDGLYWGGNFSDVKDLASGGLLVDGKIKFFMGYSGWDKGQLESEIKKDYWLVTDSSLSEIMSEPDNIWKSALKRLGGRYKIWSNFPVNPDSN